ncbi:DUF3500 domain-containing protein [Actinoplanes sp. CA-131856]
MSDSFVRRLLFVPLLLTAAACGSDTETTVQGERTTTNLAPWSNLPDQLFERAGLGTDALSDTQQAAVPAILKAGLSTDGFHQVVGITTADGVLARR